MHWEDSSGIPGTALSRRASAVNPWRSALCETGQWPDSAARCLRAALHPPTGPAAHRPRWWSSLGTEPWRQAQQKEWTKAPPQQLRRKEKKGAFQFKCLSDTRAKATEVSFYNLQLKKCCCNFRKLLRLSVPRDNSTGKCCKYCWGRFLHSYVRQSEFTSAFFFFFLSLQRVIEKANIVKRSVCFQKIPPTMQIGEGRTNHKIVHSWSGRHPIKNPCKAVCDSTFSTVLA